MCENLQCESKSRPQNTFSLSTLIQTSDSSFPKYPNGHLGSEEQFPLMADVASFHMLTTVRTNLKSNVYWYTGILGSGESRQETREGLEVVMATNYFGPFLLTNLLLDAINLVQGSHSITVVNAHQANLSLSLSLTHRKSNHGGEHRQPVGRHKRVGSKLYLSPMARTLSLF